MDVPNEGEDDLYQVPRSSNEINLPAAFPSAVPEETPPALMPKRLSGFQRTSSLLDRQFPSSTPHPPPRSSRSACSNPKDHRTVSQISSTKSLDLTEPHQFKADEESIPKQTAKTILSATPSKKPLPPIPQTAQATPASTLGNNVSVNKNNDITTLQPSNHTSNSTSMTRPVPKPRPRTKVNVLSTPSQNLDSNSATQQTAVISSSPHSDSKQQISVIKNHKVNESSLETSTADEENISSFSYSLPLDADSIELMLNDEVDKKYGLKSTENKHPESGNHQLNINTDDNDEYVNPDELKKDISALRNNEKADSKPPMPHSTVQASSYLPMNDKSQHGQTAASQLPPLLKRRPSLPVSVPKVDIGSDLFGESSSDDILEPKDSSDEKFNASTCLNVTTPKPFNDIKPFKSFKSASILPSAASGKDTLQETKTQDLDFSDFDPLWSGKPKLAQASNINQKDKVNFSNGNKTVSDFSADFNFLTDSSEYQSSNIPSSTYATADDICAEDYCSEIERESKTKTTSGPWRSPSNRKSFHHEAPIAPPPPLPRQQNRIPEPRPPPVPPRPDNALVLPHPPNTQTLPPPPNALSYSTTASTDIFQDLPTPVFMPAQNNDPFHDSNFDYECLKFNKNQVPTPPSRSPLPKTSTLHVERSSNESNAKAASIDPSLDPGRISRFVIPPPGCPLNDSLNNEGYDLARELSSSDSESTDFPILDTSFQGWPPGAVPVSMPLKVFDGSLSQNKSSRDGYLYKQGGYKANKGWKKRWVVFNGSSLSYYTSNTSQVSKRIIPVRCMIRTETDIKDTDKNSFKFKVITSLKDRVFLFSSETLDDCIKWASVIMAAITEYKKSVGSGEELPPEKPDKEGFIKFGNLRKYYVTITGKTLCYYQSFEDYQMGSPTHEIDMKLCAVKVKDNKKLQLWIHYGQFDLTFESEQEMQQWRMAMEDAIAEGLADDTVLNKVYENLSNHNCADCNADNPHWASINLGIVVCKMCAGVHRMFDYRISKIRSLRMDTRVWTPSLIEIMITIGNANANTFWEFDVPEGAKTQPTDTMDKRKEYIVRKYKHKEFCNLHPLANCGSALGEALLTAASNDNVLELIKILFSGVDVLFKRDEHGHTAYDIAKENGQRLIMELLYQNGGDPKTLEQDVRDENRLKEDIRLQGFLNKSGPIGKTFKRRWCILEHGALTYYLNEKSNTSKGSIDRKDMYMIQIVDADRLNYSFELSTKLEDNRVFTFSSESSNDCSEWVRTVAKLMAPIAVMDHVGTIDIKLAGYAYIKESVVDEWRQTFIVFSWRVINYMNRDLKFNFIDLRKAGNIKMQDSSSGYLQRGQCFVISSTGKSVYLQATLARDTEKMYAAFLEASTSSGKTLNDQALTNENVPVIVERCITHIHMNGVQEKGIYRTAGQNSKVQELLDHFRRDAWSVSLSDYTVQDVANVLKRFLRELEDSVFERINYGSWINMAGCQDKNSRLVWYKYYLEKMPLVNFQTLKRIVLHLLRVSESEQVNLMSITNLASCFAPSLMRTATDEQPSLTSDVSSKEISIMVDLMSNADYFFNVNDTERLIRDNIQRAEIEIQKWNQDKLKAVTDMPATGILTPIHLLCKEGQSVNILVTESKTAKEAMDDLKRNKIAPDLRSYVLYEQLFRGSLERPLFPEDLVALTTKRWAEWESWVMEDNSVCLCVQGPELLEKLDNSFNRNHELSSKLQYCDAKSRKFKRKTVRFQQCKLALYSDSQGISESISWKVEDMTIYLGTMHKKNPTPSRYCLTFTVSGEKYTKPPFGHCLCFDTEDELYRWAAAMYTAQHPAGLLSWLNK